MKLLENKVALITGASKGIGLSIAKVFAKHGANVAFTYLNSVEAAHQLETVLQAESIQAKGYRSDASDYSASEQLFNEVIKDFGKIDILINNAGITQDGLLLRMSEEQWEAVIKTNLKSCFNTVKHATKLFLKQKKWFYHKHNFYCRDKRKRRAIKLCRF